MQLHAEQSLPLFWSLEEQVLQEDPWLRASRLPKLPFAVIVDVCVYVAVLVCVCQLVFVHLVYELLVLVGTGQVAEQ